MTQFASSNFTLGTPGITLQAFDATWVRHAGSTASVNGVISTQPDLMGNNVSGAALYYYNVAPGTADYSAMTTIKEITDIPSGLGPCVRMSPTLSTFYHARWYFPGGTDVIQLFSFKNGAVAQLGADQPANFTTGTTRDLRLEALDSGGDVILNIYIDGNPTPFFTYTELAGASPITTAGFAGIRLGYGGATIPTDTTGPHMLAFSGDTAGSPAVNNLSIANAASNAAAGNVTVTQTQVLVIDGAASTPQAADVSITIGAAITLDIAGASSTPQAANVSITISSGTITLVILGAISQPVIRVPSVEIAHNNSLTTKAIIPNVHPYS